jgi:PST family polysaccharide transporter
VLTAVIHYLLLEREVKIGLKFYPRNYIKVAYVKTKSLIGNVTGFNMINYWAGNSDALLIGKLYGEASLGLYNRAYSLMAIALNLIGGLFNLVLYPSFKEHQSTGGDIRKEYEDILGLISLMNFPIGFILIVFPVQLVSVLWGSNWISVSEFLPYFGLLIMCKTMLASTTNVYILLGEEKLNMIIGSISAVTMIVAIVAGAFISLRYVAFMHALAYIAFVLPVNVYWGFYKAIGYPFKFIIRFWLPKVLFFLCLLFSIHENQKTLSVIFLLAYFLHILFLQRKNIKRLFVSGRPVFS